MIRSSPVLLPVVLLLALLSAGCDSSGEGDPPAVAQQLEGSWTGSAADDDLDLDVSLQLEAQAEDRLGGRGDFSGTATSRGGVLVELDFDYEDAALTGSVEAEGTGQRRLRIRVLPGERFSPDTLFFEAILEENLSEEASQVAGEARVKIRGTTYVVPLAISRSQ